MAIAKFTPEYLKGLQEHVYKSYLKTPDRVRLGGMERDLDPGEHRAIVYFEACLTILNHMGALKDGALDYVVPDLINKTNESVW
jgi:hypothetical protein